MGSFGPKLKVPERFEKRFYEHNRVVVYKKPLQTTNNETILKMAKIGQDAKAIAFAKWSVWVKN